MLDIANDEIIQNIKNINDKYQELILYLMQGKGNIIPLSLVDPDKIHKTLLNISEQFLANPQKFLQINIEYVEQLNNLIASSLCKFTGQDAATIFSPSNNDRRFKDPAWQDNIYFDFVKQFYLMSKEFVQKNIEQYDLQPELRRYLDFITRQFVDALAPSNFIYSNPEVLKEIFDSGFSNIVKGLDNFLDDIKKSGDILNIQTTDQSAFKLGENIATTEGKIVLQNDLMQLICYKPNNTAYNIPILILPPWINKYYILDLSPHNSLIAFLVRNNFQVFVVSWVNPDQNLANKNFEDYLQEGFLEPAEYIIKLGYEKINVFGYCIGGTLLAIGIAYLKAHNINYVSSASFITTLLDFGNPGEVGAFISESSITAIEKEMESKGYFEGKYLSNIFSLLRANDLVWSFFVNNYLLGKNPMPFDLLYWNSDSTNLPYKMHSYYLRNMYLNNLLKVPNSLQLLGVPIDLTKIDCRSFFVAANEDHIAPWKSVYDSSKLVKSDDKVFCLTSSGHVAGIINPPTSLKNHYKICEDLSLSSDEWLVNSNQYQGSWWLYWQKWLEAHNNVLTEPIDYDKLDFIEYAPGSYAKGKIR
jgi:polyhydroxyalkanoate synthase